MCPKQSSRVSNLPASPFYKNMKVTKQAAVVEIKRVTVEPAKIILELTEIEAKVLTAIMGSVNNDEVFSSVEDTFEPVLRVYRDLIPARFNHMIYNVLLKAVKEL
jgi:hypothetical protein